MRTSASTHGTTGRAVAMAGALVFVASLIYGAWSYARRFGTELPAVSAWTSAAAAAVDVALFTAFAFHHSLFARTSLRHWVASIVPPGLERSTYVWVSSVLFIVVMAAWQPVGGTLWRTDGVAALALLSTQLVGVVVTLRAAAALDVFSLAGVRQAFGREAPQQGLVDRGLYAFVRHPLYFGWMLMVWATPVMTGTRLVFAAVSTLYLVLAIPLEERSLRRELGAEYDRYTARVRWRLVRGVY